MVLTPEQRSARGFDKSWSPKAIAGMFVGVWHNARKNIFHYLMFDGTRILETTSNIRLVGDCFPWKLQLERDGPIGLHLESDPLGGDDDEPSPAPCGMCGHVSSSNAYRCALQHQAHVEHGIAQRQVAFLQEYDPTIVPRFAASYNANMVHDRQERIQASRGIKPSLQRSLKQAPSGQLTDVFAIPATPDAPVPLDRPQDHSIPEAPPLFQFVKDHCFNVASIPDFSDAQQVPPSVRHPYTRFVGRRIRKMFPRYSALPFEGTVDRISTKRARNLFHIRYDDGDDEEMDLLQLLEHVILDKEHGDDVASHGLTRWEMNLRDAQSAIVMAAYEEAADYISDHQDSSSRYRVNAHMTITLDGTVIPGSMPTPVPAAKSSTPRRATFKDGHDERLYDCSDAERRWNQASVDAIDRRNRVHIARPDFPACTKAANCECERCQYFWRIEGGSVRWDEVLASRHASGSTPSGKKSKAALEVELLAQQRAQQGLEDTPTPPVSPAESWTPQNNAEVLRHPQKDLIKIASRAEITQIRDTGTGVIASDEEVRQALAAGQKILPSKMVYKLKYKTVIDRHGVRRDVPDKWKCRLAAVGSREQPGLDFATSTFSPTVGMTAIRTLVALCCDKRFDLRSYDLSGAYLGTPLTRPVYIRLPPDADEDAGKILRCEKAIYGLRDSSAAFCKYLGEQVMSFRHKGHKFRQLNTEQCLYSYEDDEGNKMLFCHYVDDLAIASTNTALRDELLQHINKTWRVTDEGVLQRFIGINFWRDQEKESWHMSLGPYIDKMAKRFDLEHAAPSDVPIDPGFILTPEDLNETPTPAMMSEYRSLIGSIGFAATSVRFDIAYAVSVLSRHLARPCRKVIDEAKRCIRYLIATRDFTVSWSVHSDHLDAALRDILWAAGDASYAADPITRRSHGGYLTYLNGGPISWKSGLQKLVCLSSAESEFVALTSCLVEVRYLRMLLAELGYAQTQPTEVLEDNQAAIVIAEGTVSGGGRAKHIDVRFKHAAECVRNGICKVRYIASAWNYADLMTKPLSPIKFRHVRDLCVTPHARPADAVSASPTDAFFAHFGDIAYDARPSD